MAVVLYRKLSDGEVERCVFPCATFRNELKSGKWFISKTGEETEEVKEKTGEETEEVKEKTGEETEEAKKAKAKAKVKAKKAGAKSEPTKKD